MTRIIAAWTLVIVALASCAANRTPLEWDLTDLPTAPLTLHGGWQLLEIPVSLEDSQDPFLSPGAVVRSGDLHQNGTWDYVPMYRASALFHRGTAPFESYSDNWRNERATIDFEADLRATTLRHLSTKLTERLAASNLDTANVRVSLELDNARRWYLALGEDTATHWPHNVSPTVIQGLVDGKDELHMVTMLLSGEIEWTVTVESQRASDVALALAAEMVGRGVVVKASDEQRTSFIVKAHADNALLAVRTDPGALLLLRDVPNFARIQNAAK